MPAGTITATPPMMLRVLAPKGTARESVAPESDVKKYGPLVGGLGATIGVGAAAYGAWRLRKLARHPLGVGLVVGGALLALSGGTAAAATAVMSSPKELDPTDPNPPADPDQPTEPPAGDTWNLRLGQLNVKNLFDLVDDPKKQDNVPTAAEHQLHLKKLALTIRDVLVTPDVISLEEVENEAVLQELVAMPELKDLGYKPLILEGRDPRGIDNAFLYRADRVQPSDVEQFDPKAETKSGRLTPVFTRPSLVASFVPVEAPDAAPVTIYVNHLTSKLQQKDGERRRLQQATQLAGVVDARLAADPQSRIVVVGDMNDGPDSPPIKLLTGISSAINGARLLDPTTALEADDRFSYKNGKQRDLLDHALLSPSLAAEVTGVWIPHTNTLARAADRRNPEIPNGASDHDGVVVDLALAV